MRSWARKGPAHSVKATGRMKSKCMSHVRLRGHPQNQVPPSSTGGGDAAATQHPQEDSWLWEQGPPPFRGNKPWRRDGAKIEARAHYGICCDAEDSLLPPASWSLQNTQPTYAFHLNQGVHGVSFNEWGCQLTPRPLGSLPIAVQV